MTQVTSQGTTSFNVRVDKESGRIKVPPSVGGLDMDQMVEAYREAYDAKLIKPQEKLDKLEERATALSEIQGKMQAFHDATKVLQGASVLGESGVFGLTKPTLNTLNGLPGENYFTVIPSAGLEPTNFEIEVEQLASKDSVKAAATFADKTAALNLEGDLTFTGPDPDVVITIEATDSAKDIRDRINGQKETLRIEAEIIPSGSDFKLVFKSLDYADPVTFTKNITSGDDTLLPDTSATAKADLQARFYYRGEESIHDTNAIDINGYKFQLLQPTKDSGGVRQSINVTTDYDRASTYQAISDWVEAYNDARETMRSYTKISGDLFDITGDNSDQVQVPLLGTNRFVLEMESFLENGITGSVPGLTGSTLKSLNDIGVTLETSGQLKLDGLALNDALQNNYKGVAKVMLFDSTSSNSQQRIIAHPEKIDSALTAYDDVGEVHNNFTLQVSRDNDGNLSATLTDAFSGAVVNVSPTTVHANEDTDPYQNITDSDGVITVTMRDEGVFKGFKFQITETIANNESSSSTFQVSQGVMDKSLRYTSRLLTMEGQLGSSRSSTEFELEADRLKGDVTAQSERMDRIKARNEFKIRALERQLMGAINALSAMQQVKTQLNAVEQAMAAAAA